MISATCLTQDRKRSGKTRAEEVRDHLTEAADLADRTGETRAWHLNFGPTNVGIHHVSLNTDLGLHCEAVQAKNGVHPETLAEAPGRQAAFHADLGRSLTHLRGREADAVAVLLTAEQIAPQRIHANVCEIPSNISLIGSCPPALPGICGVWRTASACRFD
ncbi:hypothetical protein [Streptomyces antimycoticus]|uniref:hypothetical protein n=1 Tax=Streptomyces antimycoticus TaxID=68175 RepID=UPI001F2274A9|nr:hypothetical protein [Streptomyces antimycoticus]